MVYESYYEIQTDNESPLFVDDKPIEYLNTAVDDHNTLYEELVDLLEATNEEFALGRESCANDWSAMCRKLEAFAVLPLSSWEEP